MENEWSFLQIVLRQLAIHMQKYKTLTSTSHLILLISVGSIVIYLLSFLC